MNRRNRFAPLFIFAGGLLFIGYSYYIYSNLSNDIKEAENISKNCDSRNKILKQQLKVVYHHSAKLEEALRKEKESHKNAKQEYATVIKDYQLNITKSKHEARNRFSALDTNYKMLKANYDELTENHVMLQQQYNRLSEDHKRITDAAKTDYESLKNSKDTESFSLQSRIQELFNSKVHYQELAKLNQDYYEKTMGELKAATELARQYMNRVKQLEDDTSIIKEKQDFMNGSVKATAELINNSTLNESAISSNSQNVDSYMAQGDFTNETKEHSENVMNTDKTNETLQESFSLQNNSSRLNASIIKDRRVQTEVLNTRLDSLPQNTSDSLIDRPSRDVDQPVGGTGDESKELIETIKNNTTIGVLDLKDGNNNFVKQEHVDIPDRLKGNFINIMSNEQKDAILSQIKYRNHEKDVPFKRELAGKKIHQNDKLMVNVVVTPTIKRFVRREKNAETTTTTTAVTSTTQTPYDENINKEAKKKLSWKDILKTTLEESVEEKIVKHKPVRKPASLYNITNKQNDNLGNPIGQRINKFKNTLADNIISGPADENNANIKNKNFNLNSKIDPILIESHSLDSANSSDVRIKWQPMNNIDLRTVELDGVMPLKAADFRKSFKKQDEKSLRKSNQLKPPLAMQHKNTENGVNNVQPNLADIEEAEYNHDEQNVKNYGDEEEQGNRENEDHVIRNVNEFEEQALNQEKNFNHPRDENILNTEQPLAENKIDRIVPIRKQDRIMKDDADKPVERKNNLKSDVKSVTLEDDENGDQNLDAGNGGVAAANQGDGEHEENEEETHGEAGLEAEQDDN